jgi:dipeptidyl aminopeptidase/acylaminoacyl peptidase
VNVINTAFFFDIWLSIQVHMKFQSILPILSLLLLGSCATKEQKETAVKENPAPLLDYKLFFKNPEKSGFKISRDGKYFSYRADFHGKQNIFAEPVAGGPAVRVTSDTSRSIFRYFWKNDRIVFQQDAGGDENFQIYSVKPDGSEHKALTAFPGHRCEIMDDLSFIPGMEDQMLVSINKRTKEYFDPYMLNIKTGELKLLYENKENFDSWVSDNAGVIRMATKTDGVNNSYYYREDAKHPFRKILTTNFRESFNPESFDGENNHIYVLSNIGRDKVTLAEYDPASGKEIKELFADPDYDLEDVFFDRQKKSLAAVIWTADKMKYHFFDQEWQSMYDSLRKQFPDYQLSMTTYDDNRSKGIVWTGSDRRPGVYYLFDFGSRSCREVANAYPWLKEGDLAEMQTITYKTRDGLSIHGYLTVPKGIPAKNLPVIVNPHGGPWARDAWGYDSEIQFLANRGYAVLQMNFRGSTGYGKKFWMASFKEWGKKMQDDVSDGVQWLAQQGISDPKRVAIYGGSYGGYSTLAGICFSPDLYACAVDYVGVSNLFTFMKTIPPYWKPYLDQFHEMVGDPVKDSALLASASPALHTDKIRVPLLIAQGANDPRVNKNESDQIVEGLKKRGIDVEYIVKNNEGHGFANEDNRFEFYGAMERFFDKHLKTKQEKDQKEMAN